MSGNWQSRLSIGTTSSGSRRLEADSVTLRGCPRAMDRTF